MDITIPVKNDKGDTYVHEFKLAMAWDPNGRIQELVFVGRGKIGHGLDLMLHDLGIKISRALQGRDPETGAVLAEVIDITTGKPIGREGWEALVKPEDAAPAGESA